MTDPDRVRVFLDGLREEIGLAVVPDEILVNALRRATSRTWRDHCYLSLRDKRLIRQPGEDESVRKESPCGAAYAFQRQGSVGFWYRRGSSTYATLARVTCPVCLAWFFGEGDLTFDEYIEQIGKKPEQQDQNGETTQ